MYRHPRHRRVPSKRRRSSGWIFWVIAILGIAGILFLFLGMRGESRSEKAEIRVSEKEPKDFITRIDGAIEDFRVELGIPKRSVHIRKKEAIPQLPNSKVSEITMKVNKNFPAALINYFLKRAIINSGGTILDDVEKKSGAELDIKIGYGDILTHRIKIRRKSGAPVDSAYVALLIDDFGYYPVHISKKIFEMGIKLTAAILPNAKYTAYVLNTLENYPKIERFVHIPMEPKTYPQVDPGPDAILVKLGDREIKNRVEKMLSEIPGAVGANNHMGSRATENKRVMFQVLRVLRDAGFFFVDSRTTPYSVSEDIAKKIGVPATHIDHIIDPPGLSSQEIEMRLFDYCFSARKMKAMIINCHSSDTTAEILKRDVPVLKKYGVKFIPVSAAFERKQNGTNKEKNK